MVTDNHKSLIINSFGKNDHISLIQKIAGAVGGGSGDGVGSGDGSGDSNCGG